MRILLTGASGQLGAYLIDRLLLDGHEPIAWSGRETGDRGGIAFRPVELTNSSAIEMALAEADPAVILHAAAISATDAVLRDPDRARAINVEATRRLAEWSEHRGRRLVFTSTDLVFDGSRAWNREDDPADPILAYGRTKVEAEAAVLNVPGGLVARVSLLYGPSRCGRPYFFTNTIDAIRRGDPVGSFEDEHRTPLDMATAAEILVRLATSEQTGLFHVAGAERVSRLELMRRSAAALGCDPTLVRANRRSDVALPEPRPADVSLDTTKLASVFPDLERPTIEEALGMG
jgi:dTDP-4-dehydrorhamnose reductase